MTALPCPDCRGAGFHEPYVYSDHRECCDYCGGAGTVEATTCCGYCDTPVSGTWCESCENAVEPVLIELVRLANAYPARVAEINATADAMHDRWAANSVAYFARKDAERLTQLVPTSVGYMVEAAE